MDKKGRVLGQARLTPAGPDGCSADGRRDCLLRPGHNCWRIERTGRLAVNLELAWKTVLEEKRSYEAAPVTQGGIGYRRVSEVYGSEARLFVMDIPLLDDADDVGRVMTGYPETREQPIDAP